MNWKDAVRKDAGKVRRKKSGPLSSEWAMRFGTPIITAETHPFLCSVSGCEKRFKAKMHLANHQKKTHYHHKKKNAKDVDPSARSGMVVTKNQVRAPRKRKRQPVDSQKQRDKASRKKRIKTPRPQWKRLIKLWNEGGHLDAKAFGLDHNIPSPKQRISGWKKILSQKNDQSSSSEESDSEE